MTLSGRYQGHHVNEVEQRTYHADRQPEKPIYTKFRQTRSRNGDLTLSARFQGHRANEAENLP